MFDRDEQEISRIIAEGLEAILSGESTLEEVIAAHPEQAGVLRPELEAANWLMSRQTEVAARPGFVSASRKRVVQRIQEEASSQNAKHSFFGMIWPQRVAYRWVAALSIFFILLSGMGGVVTISQSSLPGDDLYQVKRAYEQVAISVAPTEAQRASLAAQYSRRRLDEAKQLISKGDYAAAESSLADFEQGVNQAVTLLQQVPDKQLNDKQNAAVTLQNNLSNNADQLAQLAPSVPKEILSVVIHARDTSINGVVVAAKVIDEVKEKKSTTPGSPQPTNPGVNTTPGSNSQDSQPVLLPSSTARPTATATQVYIPPTAQPPAVVLPTTAPPSPANTPEVTLAPTQVTVTVDPTSTIAPSETPTNIPSPTATAVPPTPTAAPSDTPTATPPPPTPVPASLAGSQTPTQPPTTLMVQTSTVVPEGDVNLPTPTP